MMPPDKRLRAEPGARSHTAPDAGRAIRVEPSRQRFWEVVRYGWIGDRQRRPDPDWPIARVRFKDFSAADLGGVAITAALERSGVRPDQVQYVIMGQVLQAGAGQIPARQAAVKAGIPMSVPALTLNKVCLSGLDAIALADQLIRAGEFDIVVAGGQESMTNAPHLLPKSRSGYKYGAIEMLDSMAYDGLTDVFDHIPMGEATDRYNTKLGIGREAQDEFAARSHQRAAEAIEERVVRRRDHPGDRSRSAGAMPIEVIDDEGIRPDTTAESLARLRPAFGTDGTITAGSPRRSPTAPPRSS